MRSLASIAPLLVVLVGCQQPSTSSQTPKPAEAAAVTAPAKFEMRDFKLDEQKQSYGGAIYKGRGTLVSKDPTVSKGRYMVWLTVKQAHKNDEQWRTVVLLHDGIGTVETSDYLGKDDVEKKAVKYVDWKILGYSALSAGTIDSEGSASSN